jgi:hypothetical protein
MSDLFLEQLGVGEPDICSMLVQRAMPSRLPARWSGSIQSSSSSGPIS